MPEVHFEYVDSFHHTNRYLGLLQQAGKEQLAIAVVELNKIPNWYPVTKQSAARIRRRVLSGASKPWLKKYGSYIAILAVGAVVDREAFEQSYLNAVGSGWIPPDGFSLGDLECQPG